MSPGDEHPQNRSAPPSLTDLPLLPWHQRLNVIHVTLLLFAVAIVFSLPALKGSGRDLDYFGNTLRFIGYFFPPDFSVSKDVFSALGETLQIAVLATAISVLLALPLAIAGARTLSPRWLVLIARMTMNVIRTIPSLVWALVGVAIVGANPLAGVIGLSFYSLGYLGKFFSDAFESIDNDVALGLQAIGADRVQAFQHGVWPHAKPIVWSHALWMLEYNIRSASIIGIVGAGGVGMLLHSYQEYYQWGKFAAVLVFILGLVTFLDLLGEWARTRMTKRLTQKR